jgi:hypothetical protein
MRKLLVLGCLALAAGCSPLRATPPKAVTPIPKPVPQVQDCPADWTATIWVKADASYVQDIETVSKVDAVHCTRYVGDSDSDRTPVSGVMLQVKESQTDAVLQRLTEVGYEASLGSMG